MALLPSLRALARSALVMAAQVDCFAVQAKSVRVVRVVQQEPET